MIIASRNIPHEPESMLRRPWVLFVMVTPGLTWGWHVNVCEHCWALNSCITLAFPLPHHPPYPASPPSLPSRDEVQGFHMRKLSESPSIVLEMTGMGMGMPRKGRGKGAPLSALSSGSRPKVLPGGEVRGLEHKTGQYCCQ